MYHFLYFDYINEPDRYEFVDSYHYVLFDECCGKSWSIRVEYLDSSGNVVGWSEPLFTAPDIDTLRRMVEMALSIIPCTDTDSCPKKAPLAAFETGDGG